MEQKKKIALASASAALACAVAVMGTVAYLHTEAAEVTNTFTPAGAGKLVDSGAFALKEHKVAFFPNEVGSDGAIGAYHYVTEAGTKSEAAEIPDSPVPLAGPEAAAVTENEYGDVLPGMTLPKDPYVEIRADGKTEVASFLYVRVEADRQEDLMLLDGVTQEELSKHKLAYYEYEIDLDDGRSGATGNWMPLSAASAAMGGGSRIPNNVYVYTAGTHKAVPIAKKEGKLQYGVADGNEMRWTEVPGVSENGYLRINILKDKKVTINGKAETIKNNASSSGGGSTAIFEDKQFTGWHLKFYGYMAQAFDIDGPDVVFSQVFCDMPGTGGDMGDMGSEE